MSSVTRPAVAIAETSRPRCRANRPEHPRETARSRTSKPLLGSSSNSTFAPDKHEPQQVQAAQLPPERSPETRPGAIATSRGGLQQCGSGQFLASDHFSRVPTCASHFAGSEGPGRTRPDADRERPRYNRRTDPEGASTESPPARHATELINARSYRHRWDQEPTRSPGPAAGWGAPSSTTGGRWRRGQHSDR